MSERTVAAIAAREAKRQPKVPDKAAVKKAKPEPAEPEPAA